MKVYFVRHGQTDSNRNKLHQTPETPLSEIGLKQAEALGKRFATIPVDVIISSTFTRAHQTAQAIQRVTQKEVITNELFVEKRNPSLFRGKSHADPSLTDIKNQIIKHRDDPTWHYSDEENFHDLLTRAKQALLFIREQSEENIVVVSHGYMLSLFILTMLFNDEVTPQIMQDFDNAAHAHNTGITLCEYINNKWKLLTWNDFAHLGD